MNLVLIRLIHIYIYFWPDVMICHSFFSLTRLYLRSFTIVPAPSFDSIYIYISFKGFCPFANCMLVTNCYRFDSVSNFSIVCWTASTLSIDLCEQQNRTRVNVSIHKYRANKNQWMFTFSVLFIFDVTFVHCWLTAQQMRMETYRCNIR